MVQDSGYAHLTFLQRLFPEVYHADSLSPTQDTRWF
jgi:hypothetical protein